MRFRLDPLAPTGVSVLVDQPRVTSRGGFAGSPDITRVLQPGTNVTFTGNGTQASPYIVNATSGGGGGSALEIKDEGVSLDTAVTSINVVGAGATATNVGHVVTLTVPDGGAGKLVAASNLSDLASAATARTNLGLVIGTDVEAHDTDLTTIAALTPTNDDVIQRKAGAWTNRTPAQLKTDLALAKGDVGLGNVDNTADAAKAVLSATKWTTPRNLAGNSVDGSAAVPFANNFIVQGTTDAGLSAAQFLGALGTGIVKNTTSTGVLSIAVAGDFPTLNQSTTGSAATLTTPRTIAGVSFDGSANIALASTNLSDTASIVLLASTQTLTGKSLTTPKIASLYQDSIGGSNLLTMPAATDTLVGKATADNLTNKGLDSTTTTFRDTTDATKRIVMDLSGISTGQTRTIVWPNTGITVVGSANTGTLTNKRVTKRAPAVTQAAAPIINTDNTDVAHITGLAQAITSMTTNLTGTPVEGDTLRVDITDNGTARAITWGASFESSGTVALPTTTVLGVRLDVGFVWNTVTTKWRCVAVS